ncbi:hypothetical protein L1049_004895 [Liquidambar formosana]|uniref:Uncharacterized protein n=1 Tax=Liquidambar formosana TaxID=63359 RepID=A0AAP0RQ03_LIQFO
MGWPYPDLSFEDLLKLIKGFVDILILASGYQSSGYLAHWDAQNIKKAFQWSLFFENLLRHLIHTDDYQDSVKELDAALFEMTSNPSFPQGLAHMSSVTLARARDFVLAHLLHTLPLRNAHLRAFLLATIDMDLDELRETENDCLHVYLDKLMLLNTSISPVRDKRGLVKDSMTSSPGVAPNIKIEGCTGNDLTKVTVQELLKRQFAVSCISSAEKGLDVLSKTIRHSNLTKSDNSLCKELPKLATASLSEDQLVEYETWNHWRSKNISYFLDKRTVRLVSGASMIFSAPKMQWFQMFEWLNITAQTNDDDMSEIIELLLLGCITSRWSSLIEHFVSVSYNSLTISKQYHEVGNLLLGGSQSLHSKEETMDSKETGILEYLIALLTGQLHQLWKLSPALAAVAIPSWSPLFRLYLSEIEIQFKGDSSTMRCCNCAQDRKEHIDCVDGENFYVKVDIIILFPPWMRFQEASLYSE